MSNLIIKKQASPRAGIIPYFWDESKSDYVYMFMVPSIAKYGGPNIQIAKGKIDKGENAFQAGIREGTEELGLVHSNMAEQPFLISEFLQVTSADEYFLHVYAVNIKDRKKFNKPHFETKFTTWVTNEQFQQIGRKSHKHIVNELNNLLHLKQLITK
jgi:8-oxo-dGTP pyrophosphatase MutT (NUDIX family)